MRVPEPLRSFDHRDECNRIGKHGSQFDEVRRVLAFGQQQTAQALANHGANIVFVPLRLFRINPHINGVLARQLLREPGPRLCFQLRRDRIFQIDDDSVGPAL
jgi:hypothetical protein